MNHTLTIADKKPLYRTYQIPAWKSEWGWRMLSPGIKIDISSKGPDIKQGH